MIQPLPTASHPERIKPGLWRRWVLDPVIGQLKQGTSPDKMGWTIGAGVGLGICPVLGTRGWLCLLAGWWFKLNQPVIHTFKGLSYPRIWRSSFPSSSSASGSTASPRCASPSESSAPAWRRMRGVFSMTSVG